MTIKTTWQQIACIGLIASVLVSGCRRKAEEIPEITFDVTVVEPRMREIPEPFLPPPTHLLPEEPPMRVGDVLEDGSVVMYVPPQRGGERQPRPGPPPPPRGPEEIPPFDRAAHMEAMAELAPVHHARMAEAMLTTGEFTEYQAQLLEELDLVSQWETIEAQRTQMVEAALAGEFTQALQDELDAMEASLHAVLEEDAKWVELRAEADAADRRRETVRQEIVSRIQDRMRHDFAVERAERAAREEELAGLGEDEN